MSKSPPPWLFGIITLPFGIGGAFMAVAMPFLLTKAGLSVEEIAKLSALAMLPSAYQLLWAPVLDLWMPRRFWLASLAVSGGLCLSACLLLKLPEQLALYKVLLVAGQALLGLVASCVGALVSVGLSEDKKGTAASWVNAGNLGGGTLLGGGMVMALWHLSPKAAALALLAVIVIPALIALRIEEPPPSRDPLMHHLGAMAVDVWRAVSARRGWSGLLLCLSPVGTAVLINLLSALGADFHASDEVVELLNGWVGPFAQGAGALAGLFVLDRVDRRVAYLASGVLTAICAGFMAVGPLSQNAYIAGCITYMVITGFAYASFSAFVYEIVGTAGKTAATLYSVFPAAGNQAIAYVTWLDGWGHQRWGPRGLPAMDAALNLGGVIVLAVLLWLVAEPRTAATAPSVDIAPAVLDEAGVTTQR